MEDLKNPPTHDDSLLIIATRLSNIEAKLDAIGSMKGLVESALGALAVESQNAAEIVELKHRVALLEGRLKMTTPDPEPPH